ncbi:MAG: radical SAM protein [Candidatus Diapherotrites archaeon]
MLPKDLGGIILSPSCANCCVFCGGHKKISDEELKRQEGLVQKNLADLRSRGIEKISISGSDPIEYGEIAYLVKYIKETGFTEVRLATHGRRLADEAFLGELVEAGLDSLRIPIYGPTAAIHDSVTQAKGSFNETIKGIKGVMEKSKNVHIQISCLIVNQNKDSLAGLIDFVRGLGITDFYFSIPCIMEEDDLSHYVPFKELGQYVKRAYAHSLKAGVNLYFLEIPFCVFGETDRERIRNKSKPPDLGKYCQPPKPSRTATKDLPAYRVKTKPPMCDKCKCVHFCDGFFANDINRFGLGGIKPIT